MISVDIVVRVAVEGEKISLGKTLMAFAAVHFAMDNAVQEDLPFLKTMVASKN